MNVSLVLKWLWRWYIVVPALVIPAALAVSAWFLVGPTYERTATLLLVPGVGTVPDEGGNPYFYLSGLTQAADVVVRAVGSENVTRDVERQFDGVQVEVSRDPTTAGPVILVVVDGATDAETAAALQFMVERTRTDLLNLQVSDRVARSNQIQLRPITIDDHSTVRQRTRLVATVGLAGFSAVLVVFIAAVLQIVRNRSRTRSVRPRSADDTGRIEWKDWLMPDQAEAAATPPDKVASGAGRVESS